MVLSIVFFLSISVDKLRIWVSLTHKGMGKIILEPTIHHFRMGARVQEMNRTHFEGCWHY